MGDYRRRAPGKSSILALCLLSGVTLGILAMLRISPPTGLATPTFTFVKEAQASLLIVASLAIVAAPLTAVVRQRLGRVSATLKRPLHLSKFVRGPAAMAFALGIFVFAFWAVADVLGGYNGYNSSFVAHPYLQKVLFASGLVYLRPLDAGTQASISIAMAIAGLVVLRSGRGLGQAIKDSFTLFAAPVAAIFELALWYFAPDDMTWHAIDALWVGGTNDMGWRALDVAGGAFIFSNWLVLMVAILLIASRLPFLGVPSQLLYRRVGEIAGRRKSFHRTASHTPSSSTVAEGRERLREERLNRHPTQSSG